MARHVRPHRWADAVSGKLNAVQVAKLERHAAACPRCAEQRDRVLAARDAFDELREQEAPRMHWDHIGARIYWVTSSERRAAERTPSRRLLPWLVAAGATATAAVALLVVGLTAGWWTSDDADAPLAKAAAAHEAAPAPVEVASPIEVAAADEPAARLQGVVTLAKGEVTINGAPLVFDGPVSDGERIETGAGMVAVQFGDRSGFVLGERSSLFLRRFDERGVELVVEGVVTLDIATRAANQHLSVVAGKRSVTVRGTVFRVDHRKGELEVACSRGHVVLADAAGEVDVTAGESLHVGAGVSVLAARARRLRVREIEGLREVASAHMLPAWTDADALYATSGTLRLAAGPDDRVSVDGVERGTGTFLLRVMSGRHHVEKNGQAGRWVDLAAGTQQEGLDEPKPSAPAVRRTQVAQALQKSERIVGCLRPLEKQGLLDGSFIELDLGINRDGSLGHLNIVESNMPLDVARCVRNRVDTVKFPAGPQATVRYRMEY